MEPPRPPRPPGWKPPPAKEVQRVRWGDLFRCPHAVAREIAALKKSNGVFEYYPFCTGCGARLPALKHRSISLKTRTEAKDAKCGSTFMKQMYELQSRWFDHIRTHRKELYYRYLASPEWGAKRAAVLSRDGYTCQMCFRSRATQVHHLNYERVGDELLEDLVSVCRPEHGINDPEDPR